VRELLPPKRQVAKFLDEVSSLLAQQVRLLGRRSWRSLIHERKKKRKRKLMIGRLSKKMNRNHHH
jgi:hypothetical protein